MEERAQQSILRGKFIIHAILHLDTGLHIGAATDFAPIGAVDSPFVRDPFSRQPIIPGSSIKGKMRNLLARSFTEGYWLKEIQNDIEPIQRLFGAANSKIYKAKAARLQFFDLRLTEVSAAKLGNMDFDTYIGEIKFENTINRLTAVANPRQIERVPAGAEFDFKLVYNLEKEEELEDDMKLLSNGLKLLQMDYLGGSGSRGYGRVSFYHFKVEFFTLQTEKNADIAKKTDEITKLLEGSKVI